MSVPGPSVVAWTGALLGLAALAVGAGEGVRWPLARWCTVLRLDDPFERLLADLYLGGALVYLLAALPVGGFAPVPVGLVLGAALASTGASLAVAFRRGKARDRLRRLFRPLLRPAYLVSLLAAGALGVVELATAGAAATGNTFDASVDTLFVALLNLHGSIPLTLAPVAAGAVAYPQGAPVWFALGQAVGGLPPPRAALLVTPLFLALPPLAAFAVGRRWLGRETDGAAFALMFALMGPGTRYFAAGSNDFVLAFPLVLLLAAWSREWVAGDRAPAHRDALVFGCLLGYSAALNPVGAEWLGVALLLAFLLAGSGFRTAARRLGVWLETVGVGLLWVAPSLVGVAKGGTAPGPGGAVGLGTGAFVSLADPFVIRPDVLTFSPFVLLSLELALLLVVGAVVLLWPTLRPAPSGAAFARWALAGTGAALLWLALGPLATVLPALGGLLTVTSFGEMSVLLFAVYSFVAAVPLALLLREVAGTPGAPSLARRPEGSGVRRTRPAPRAAGPWILAAGLALALVLPGAVITGTDVPTVLGTLYGSFSNVTAADYALLDWAGSHLPAGARVLVAPGSAAEFLPGYAPRVVLLYPMTGPGWRSDPAYLELLGLLANGTLGPTGARDLASLNVQYIAITGNSTVLYPAISPAPFLAGPGFTDLFHRGDAYLFARAGAGPAAPPA